MCQDYNCKKKSLQNGLKDIQNSTFLFRINAIISNVASKSRSLIEDVDTNAVECFNNVIAKFIGGKRLSQIKILKAELKEIERRRAHKRKLNIENPTKKRRKLKRTHIASIAHGIENEQQAIQQIQQQEKVVISPCGLFIDEMYPFIGATPDGLISDDIIVEVKCPITAAKIEFIEAVKGNKIQILKYDKKTHQFVINKNSNWYFQIQGQLHITQRRLCLLGIWTGEKSPVHIEYIARDDDFWNQKMESKLVTFYMKCLLPELVDSRHTRGMAIRDISLQDKENIRPTLSQTQNNHDRAEPGPSTRQLILSEL
ncbi:hypothetical protein ACJJTC_017658 [Scirpophaga incertulas]